MWKTFSKTKSPLRGGFCEAKLGGVVTMTIPSQQS